MNNDIDIKFDNDRSPLEEQFFVFKISRCLPFSKWLPKYGIKKRAVKIQHCPISSKFDMWVDNDRDIIFDIVIGHH